MKICVFALLLSVGVTAAPVPFTVTGGSAPVVVDFDGFSSGGAIDGLSARLTFSDFVFTNLTTQTRVNFRLDIENTSEAPITASRVSGVGFRTTPTLVRTGSSVSGVFNRVSTGTMPIVGSMEFCFSAVNCAGGGSAGVTQGNTGTAYASLLFSGTGLTSLTFDDVFVRYQSISGAGSVTSAVGAPVPEPGAWAVLLAGGLLIALRVRSRRRLVA